ncbi:MAG: septal ring lytic transglycosylase RlpA family protein [Bacilli bacterium]|nr:septal ring lytic transglycosylase RlpA family protein [Bacilli bacterium]
MRMIVFIISALISGNSISSEHHHQRYNHHKHTVNSTKDFIQIGIASWYGYPHKGKLTKNGEIFDPQKLTAAHNTLPMGTRVKVTNLRNKMTVIVKINDTGGFAKYNRIIDLSLAAAKILGFTGLTKVKIEVV